MYDVKKSGLQNIPGLIPYNPTGKCPVFRSIPECFPIYDVSDVIGYETVDVKDPERHYWLRMECCSILNKRIQPGDCLLIRAQDYAEDGQMVVSYTGNDKPALKNYQNTDDTILGVVILSLRKL